MTKNPLCHKQRIQKVQQNQLFINSCQKEMKPKIDKAM